MNKPYASPSAADGEADLVALLGSRICHDLVSPVGAIANGVELLEMVHGASEEVQLIQGAVASATARIKFFRLAFGARAAAQVIPAREVIGILDAMYAQTRTALYWTDDQDRPRPELRLALLAVLCVETATPWGGRVEVGRTGAAWTIHAEADRLRVDERLWASLADPAPRPDLRGSEVQFGLLARDARRLRRPVSVTADETRLSLVI